MGYRILERPQSRLVRLAWRLSLVAAPLVVMAVLVTRSGKVEALYGLGLAVFGFVLSAAALAIGALALIEIWTRGALGFGRLIAMALLNLALLAYPGYLAFQAVRLPILNDISSDLADPPQFSTSPAALAARNGRTPPAPEPGAREAQARAYRDIKPLILDVEAEEAFELARAAAKSLRWRIIEEVPPGGRNRDGRIDAVAETALLRFSDDITIRIRAAGNQTRIDIRSASRLGRHDLGANGARIRRFFSEIVQDKE